MSHALSHVHVNCAREGCYAVVTLHPQEERRLRQTREQFYCPAGHSNYFPGKSQEAKRIERLERHIEDWRDRWKDEYDRRERLTQAARVCPLGCGWSTRRVLAYKADEDALRRFLDRVGGDLAEHLIAAHNATRAPVALLAAGAPERGESS